jgi:hypothetical protein
LTNTANITHEDAPFPTEWHDIDVLAGTECRQLTENTFELRSFSHTIVVDREGFDLYREDSTGHAIQFEEWCKAHNIVAMERPQNEVVIKDEYGTES